MRSSRRSALWLLFALAACVAPRERRHARVVLCDAGQVLAGDERALAAGRVVLRVEERDSDRDLEAAVATLARLGIPHAWWLEVARSPSLADAHPEHMASLQGHDEWRVLAPDAPRAADGSVLKVHPWVPLTTAEGFELQRARLAARLAALPPADEVYLADLQGAPSACGCGHPRCRWATDYFLATPDSPRAISSGTPLGPEAAARFVAALRPAARGATLIPVWMAECDEADELCHGVPCFAGACWPALARQWAPLVAENERLAVLVLEPARVERELAALVHLERPNSPPIALDRTRLVPVVAAELPGAIQLLTDLEQSFDVRLWR
ncbi:MAG: hypothetical protein EXS08_13970 [Planctomycetes bacterium]|nr:hypothetical protein [Planctomycetota bacterium]